MATTVFPLPTSPCRRRRIGFSRRMSARTSSMTRSCAAGQAEGEALQEGVEEAAVAPVPAADLGPLHARLAGGETGLDQEELVEDQTPHRRRKKRPLRREMDLVYRVVQIGQAVAHEHVGRQRVEDAPGRVERAVDERPHPARLYALVDRVDGDEASGVRSFVAPGSSTTSILFAAIWMP